MKKKKFKQRNILLHSSVIYEFIHFTLFCADEPENVDLNTPSSAVCIGSMVTFTCTADANPPVHTYRLYKNGGMNESLGGSGVTTKPLNTSGRFKYSCDASNSEGTGTSNNTVLTVEGEFA